MAIHFRPIEIDWDNPVERARLIECAGPVEYARMQQQHIVESTIKIVNGYRLRKIRTERWGILYLVYGNGSAAVTLANAESIARKLPRGPHAPE